MLIAATTTFLFLHAAAATFFNCSIIKVDTCLLTHAIMYFHGNARRHGHVKHSHNRKQEFFHLAKVIRICDKGDKGAIGG